VSYDELYRQFRWRLPESFNFASDVVDRWAEDPGKLALVWCDESGLRKGDRCIVMLPRLPQWQLAMVGCLRIGVIPIPCIDMLTQKDVRYRVEHSGAIGAITTAANTTKFAGLAGLRLRAAVGSAPGWLDFVVLKSGWSGSPALAAELQEHVKRTTAPYKYPREIEFVSELPKNASGKLLRRVLRDREYRRSG